MSPQAASQLKQTVGMSMSLRSFLFGQAFGSFSTQSSQLSTGGKDSRGVSRIAFASGIAPIVLDATLREEHFVQDVRLVQGAGRMEVPRPRRTEMHGRIFSQKGVFGKDRKLRFWIVGACAAGLVLAVMGCGGGSGSLGPSRIAFFSNRTGTGEVWVMDMNGANVQNVSAGQGTGQQWDPLGARIAFLSNRTGQWDIYVVNANGTGLTQLTNDALVEDDLAWAPSGNMIAYRRGSGVFARDLLTNTETLLVTTGTAARRPQYSPSGNEVAVEWLPTGVEWEIATVPATGGTPVNLTNDATNNDRMPRWSPNGAQIAWLKADNLWIMNANGTGQTQLTTSGNVTWHAFSPNGQYLLYVENDDIWRLSWNGTSWGSPVQLTNTGDNFTPCWSSDSLQIVFMSNRSGNAEIWRMAFDGTNPTNLTNDAAVDQGPVCSP
jgi:Tol biopolymer transport system component